VEGFVDAAAYSGCSRRPLIWSDAYSPPLNGVGFFEDFFYGKKRAVRTFWRVLNDPLAATVAR